jgi:hypothetical protein
MRWSAETPVVTLLGAMPSGGPVRCSCSATAGTSVCFVGGSGRPARDLPDAARTSVEDAVDAAVWSIAAVASLASTVVMSAAGYTTLPWATCALAALPAALLLRSEAR